MQLLKSQLLHIYEITLMAGSFNKITGLLLAGGQAKRMGSINKGAVVLNDRSFAELVLDNLSKQVNNVIISANEYAEYFEQFNYPVVKDLRAGFLGPLAGIEAVLTKYPSIEWLFCSTIDTPYFPSNLVSTLLEEAKKNKKLCVMPVHNKIRYPLHSLIHSNLLPSLKTFLDSNERAVGYWLRKCGVLEVEINAPFPAFENINTLEELSLLKRNTK